ncbi:hypothetical protein [Streptomyces sp. NPDC053720]|uniref:hypothetical protein n=1 Tax=Streptomyces sp. NPDC053720 TaxID=3154855 RepID=UPI003426A71C
MTNTVNNTSPTAAASFAALVEEWVRWAEAYGADLEREMQDMRSASIPAVENAGA